MTETDSFDGAALQRALRGRPQVAGVAGGVGTTTVARALDGFDRGVFVGRRVDVLVCRATGDSLVRAARAAQAIVAAGIGEIRPVIAVCSTDAAGPSRPTTARLRLLEPHTDGVVLLPYVRRWRDLAAPLEDVSGLLTRPLPDLPRALRRYGAATRQIVAALDGHPPPPPRPTSTPRFRAALPTPSRQERNPIR